MTAWEILATMEEIVQMELPLTLALAHLDSKEQIASLVSEIVLSYDFIIVLLELLIIFVHVLLIYDFFFMSNYLRHWRLSIKSMPEWRTMRRWNQLVHLSLYSWLHWAKLQDKYVKLFLQRSYNFVFEFPIILNIFVH